MLLDRAGVVPTLAYSLYPTLQHTMLSLPTLSYPETDLQLARSKSAQKYNESKLVSCIILSCFNLASSHKAQSYSIPLLLPR